MRWILGALALLWVVPDANANPEFLVPASAFGAKDCLFCHSDPGGGRNWNARGYWLMEEKQRRGLETVDTAWLDEYVVTSEEPDASVERSPQAGDRIPETFHRGPFFQPNTDAAAVQRWIDSRGTYTTAGGEWPQYSGDLASSKYSPLDRINRSNVPRPPRRLDLGCI